MPFNFPYENRVEAGAHLAELLSGYKGKDTVVVGLPRGGVVLAAEVARRLGCELDVIFAGKLRAPLNPELAIGAVSEDGVEYVNRSVARMLHITDEYIEEEKRARVEDVKKRLKLYRKVKRKTVLKDKTVIIVDDGLATGSTMTSAVEAASAEGASRIVVAVPGGPVDTVSRIKLMDEVTEVVCPHMPSAFYAVSQLYIDFQQVDDSTVISILTEFGTGA